MTLSDTLPESNWAIVPRLGRPNTMRSTPRECATSTICAAAAPTSDRFKLLNLHLSRPALCCFDDVPRRAFKHFILGQDSAPVAEIVI
jgi:hypothetical protein